MTVIETTEEYMARKGLVKGDVIGGAPADSVAAVIETTEEYMARKGIAPGEPITSDPSEVGRVVVETQLEYLARKAAEAETPPAPVDAPRKGKAAE